MGHIFNKPAEVVFIDLQNAKPTELEIKMYERVREVLNKGEDVCTKIEDYKGCQDVARKAMTSPNPENEEAAFSALLTAVEYIDGIYQQARALEEIVPLLLSALSVSPQEEKDKNKLSVATCQALAAQLSILLDFALRFDQIRMRQPFISNDFAFYRRLLPKFPRDPRVRIKDDDAGGMALFTAEYTPMMNAVCRSAIKSDGKPNEVMAIIANSCYKMLKHNKLPTEFNLVAARAMTGATIVFDHVDVVGVFQKSSPVKVTQIVNMLKSNFKEQPALLNGIQFTTKTFKNAPNSIQALFQ